MINTDPTIPPSSDRRGARRFFERIFENVDNPLGWSLKLFTVRAIVVRIHLFTVLYIAGEMLTPLLKDSAGFPFVIPLMVALFAIVLVHEFGHCAACRVVGGIADRVVLLPFGGLALCQPPHDWRSNLATTLGGPAVNVALFPLFAVLLMIGSMGSLVFFNPLFPPLDAVYMAASSESNLAFYARLTLWSIHYINIVILGFNVLLPFFPLDGGRIVQAVLWSRTSYRRSMETAIVIGFAGAGGLALFALLSDKLLLLLIAIFGALACYSERQRLRADEDLAELNLSPSPTGLGAALPPDFRPDIEPDRPAGPSRRELKKIEREEQDAVALDALLAKIGATGMGSLTGAERRTLDRLSKKKRQAGGPADPH